MTDYTPTTERIRAGFEATRMISEPPDGFDLWLTQHDRRIAAEAWDEGNSWGWSDAQEAHGVDREIGRADWPYGMPNPYRADRIEQGGES